MTDNPPRRDGSLAGPLHKASLPAFATELRRLRSLYSLDLLDSDDHRFDRFSRIAAQAFDVPVALVTVLEDEDQWFCAAVGTDRDGNLRDESFCTRLIIDDSSMLVVEETHADDRFKHLPIVEGEPHIRFYAGVSLSSPDGQRVGSLCILDVEPRTFDNDMRQMLRDLGDLVESELHHMTLALTDELTKLSNRRAFNAASLRYLALGERRGEPVSFVFCDIDGLKEVNDGLGHACGDVLLRQAADALSSAARPIDLVARIGGDEFAIVMYDVDQDDAARAVAHLQAAVRASNLGNGDPILSMSFGSATSADDLTLEQLVAAADEAMYEGRRSRTASP